MTKLADHEIIPAVLAKIQYIDNKAQWWIDYNKMYPGPNSQAIQSLINTFNASADRLRDFATVELLCEGLD